MIFKNFRYNTSQIMTEFPTIFNFLFESNLLEILF